jgi:hypothetical protein
MVVLTDAQAHALEAFFECFDKRLPGATGAWSEIHYWMVEDYGFDDPEGAIAEARRALAVETE